MSGTPDKRISESVQNASPHTGIEKKCSKCGETKTVDNFYVKAWEKKGCLYAACKKCHNAHKGRWRTNNPEKSRESGRMSARKRRITPKGRMNHSISVSIYQSLNGIKKGHHWEGIVGYTVEQLERHLEKKFEPGMTWENYGTGWHVDHKTPKTAFNFERPGDIDFRRCWSLKNLQPMWAKENMKKNAKLDKPFQPSLTI